MPMQKFITRAIPAIFIVGLLVAFRSAQAVTSIGPNISTDGYLKIGTAVPGSPANGMIYYDSGSDKFKCYQGGAWVDCVGSITGTLPVSQGGTGLSSFTAGDMLYATNATTLSALPIGTNNQILTVTGGIPAWQDRTPLVITNTFVYANLTGGAPGTNCTDETTALIGDVCIVTSTNKTYILQTAPYSVAGNWQELLSSSSQYLLKANNLSDVTNVATADSNLGLGAGNSPTFTGLSLTGLSSGSVPFADGGGLLSEDNSKLFWDNTNKRLGIGTNTPAYALDVAGDIKAGDNSLMLLGQAGSDPTGTNGGMYYNTGSNKFRCYENGAWADCISVAVGGSVFSALTPAAATNSINNANYNQTWDWSLTSANNIGLKISESSASTATGTPALAEISTLATSTATPLRVINRGTSPSFIVENVAGDTTPPLYIEPAGATPFAHTGHVAIGSNSFDPVAPEKLKVDSGTENSYNIISAGGDLNNYLQINIQNRNAGNNASSDVVATADNGNENIYYMDMGINSSGYSNPTYSIGGPDDAYILAQGPAGAGTGGNLSIGTATPGSIIKFNAGGSTATDEKARITNDALILQPFDTGAGNTLNLEFSELAANGTNYVGFKAPDSIAANHVWTLPSADGTVGQVLSTDGSGTLAWTSGATNFWSDVAGVLSPITPTDNVTTSGNMYTTGTGAITSADLLTGNKGLTVSGGDVNINTNSNFNTYINTGTSTGTVNIGSSLAGAIVIESASTVSLQGGANTITSPATEIKFQPAGAATTGLVKIGEGSAGSATPDLLALDVKNDNASDPGLGSNGAMYYNAVSNKFRCYVSGAWSDCGSASLSSISAAVAADSINNGDNAQTWNWNLTSAGKSGLALGENLAATGSGTSILNLSTLATSTAEPLNILNQGTAASLEIDRTPGDSAPPLYVNSSGNVAVGAKTFDGTYPEKFKVEAGTGTRSAMAGYGDVNDFLNLTIQNRNAGTSAASVLAAVADNGSGVTQTNTTAMGIVSSGFSNPAYPASPDDGFLLTTGGNLLIDTAYPGKGIVFATGGTLLPNLRATIDGNGNMGIGSLSPNARLDVGPATADALRIEPYSTGAGNTGGLEFMELAANGSNYVGFKAPDSIAANKIWTLPSVDGTAGQRLATDGAGTLYWVDPSAGGWQRVGTTLSPLTAGDNLTTSGAGTITSAGLLTGNAGLTINGGAVSINDNSGANATSINTGTSTGTVTIGSANAGAVGITSGAALALTGGAASTISTTAGDITLQPAGTGTTANVQIGAGQPGSGTPDLFNLDVKSTTSDPAAGVDGSMYYNEFNNRFRCHQNGSWQDCDTTGATTTLQTAYNSGATITTAGSTDIAYTLTSGDFRVKDSGGSNTLFLATGAGAVSATPTGALTLTGGAASTWGTSAGDLTLQANSGVSNNIKIGTGGSGTPNLFVVDVKNTIGDPVGSPDGAMYYNSAIATPTFRCHVNGGWQDCGATAALASTLQQAYASGNAISTTGSNIAFTLNTTDQLTASGAGSVNLTPTGASSFITSGGALTLTGGAASTWGTSAGNLSLQAAGTGTTANIQIGAGGAGSTTPDLLALDVKSSSGDPAGFEGAMYYNENAHEFRCFEDLAWQDCDGVSYVTLQRAYEQGPTITMTTTPLTIHTLTGGGDFNVDTSGKATLNPTGGVFLGSATSAVNLPNLGASSVVLTDSSKNLTSTTTLGLGNGGTGQTTKTTAFDALSPTTTKGDLIANNGTNNVRLPVGGTNGFVLQVDNSQATGMKWAATSIAANSLDFTEFKDAMTVDNNTSINLAGKNLTINDGTGGGVLTLTAGAASTWSTSAGALTVDSAAGLNLGTTNATGVSVGRSAATFALASTGLNVTTGGALTGVASLDTITTSSTALTFAGAGTISASGANNLTLQGGSTNTVSLGTSTNLTAAGALTVDSNTTSALNIGNGANAKTITLGNTTGGTAVNINAGTGNVNFTVGPTSSSSKVQIGNSGTATPDLLVMDNGTADPTGANGGMYYSTGTNTFRCYENGAWKNCIGLSSSIVTTPGDLITYTGAPTNAPTRLPVGGNGTVLAADSTQADGLHWVDPSNPLNGVLNNNLDFGNFKDSMALDATTGIGLGNFNLNITTAGTGAFTLTGGAASTVSTTAGNLTLQAGSGTVTLGSSTALTATAGLTVSSGGANALTLNPGGAAAVNIGSSNANAVNIGNTAANSAITLQSGTGAINIGTDANAKTVTIGNQTGASALTLDSGTGTIAVGTGNQARNINIGTGGAAQTITIGSSNTSSALNLTTGSGNLTVTTPNGNGSIFKTSTATDDTIRIAPGVNAGAATFQGTLTTADLTAARTWALPDVSGTLLTSANAWAIGGNAPGASSVLGTTDNSQLTIQTGTGALNVGTDAFAKTISIGNQTGASALTLDSGTGTIAIGTGAQARTINVGTGAAVQTVHIADGGAANIVTLGSANTSAATTVQSGSGGLTLTGGGASTWSTSSGALTITSAAAATWSTGSGALAVDSAAALNLGTTNATGVNISKSGATTAIKGLTTLGTATTDTVAFNGYVNSDIIPSADNTYNLGSGSNRWKKLFVKGATLDIGDNGNSLLLGYDTANFDMTIDKTIKIANLASAPAGTPANGMMYYDTVANKFQCYQNGAWTNCIPAVVAPTLQTAYNGGATITTAGGNAITLTTPIGSNNTGLVIQQNNTTNNPIALQITNAGTGNDITATNWSVTKTGTISTSGNISATGTGTITSAGLLTASNGLTQTAGALNLTATSGALTISGLGASSLSTGANNLTITAGNFNTTATGINTTNIGVTTPGTGKFTTLTSTGATDLANAGASNVTIATTGTGTVAIGNSTGTFALTSSGGLNVTTAGALTGVASIDANAVAQTITIGNSTGATSVVINDGTGALNIGTNAIAHTITIGNTTGASALTLTAGSGGVTVGTLGTGIVHSSSAGLLSSSAVALGSDVSGQLPLANGGTNANLTATNGGLFYSTATAGAILAPGTAGQILQTNGAAAPSWSTATYPATAGTSGNVLTSNGTNWTSSALSVAFGSVGAGTNTNALLVGTGGSLAPTGTGTITANQFVGTGSTTNAVDLGTAEVAGTLGVTNGGMGANMTAGAIGAIPYASSTTAYTTLADVVAGSYLRSGGTGTAPLWSTLVLPNAATQGDILYATGSNTVGNLADVAVGRVLTSGGVGANPTYSPTPTLGVAGATTGTLSLAGLTSGTITIQPQSAAGTYNFNLPTTAGTAGQLLTSQGGGATAMTWTSAASSQSTPANPTGTTSTTGVMMGLAGSITPTQSGKVMIIISGDAMANVCATTGATGGAQVQIRYGTGTAPTNGAALTGTAVGALEKWVCSHATSRDPFSVNAVVTGLTVNTAYWIDLELIATQGTSTTTANLFDISISAHEF